MSTPSSVAVTVSQPVIPEECWLRSGQRDQAQRARLRHHVISLLVDTIFAALLVSVMLFPRLV